VTGIYEYCKIGENWKLCKIDGKVKGNKGNRVIGERSQILPYTHIPYTHIPLYPYILIPSITTLPPMPRNLFIITQKDFGARQI